MLPRKPTTPIDRAIADVERQIAELERQMRQASVSISPTAVSESSSLMGTLKRWLQPPPRRSPAPPRPARRDLFDLPLNPVKELDVGVTPFEQQPDLFRSANSAGKPASSFCNGTLKPRLPLKHVQRQNRHRFYLWLVLGIVALGALWLLVR